MKFRGIFVCLIAVGVAVAMYSVGVAGAAAPSKTVVKVTSKISIKPNRYIQDGLRWNRDVYTVKSGGTVRVINTFAAEGPHTFTVVKPKDLPKTGAQVLNCKICGVLGGAHGANPESNEPPKFQFLENGVGQATAPNVDRPGDSGITGPGKKGEFIDLKVTAKPGTTLNFMCIIHPWMQAKLKVVR
jgi:hypothetical protein